MVRIFFRGDSVPSWLQRIESSYPYEIKFTALVSLVIHWGNIYHVYPVIYGPERTVMYFKNLGPIDAQVTIVGGPTQFHSVEQLSKYTP